MTAAAQVSGQPAHSAERLEWLFDELFSRAEDTVLIGGQAEPWYAPGTPNRLYYREDFFASALHEIAHWCIAGERRRRLPDFGYWYAPEGRDASQQEAFESVEARPQALEWFFSRACGYRFQVSADNLSPDGALSDNTRFKQRVVDAARAYQQGGLPTRARIFFDGLSHTFQQHQQPETLRFNLALLC